VAIETVDGAVGMLEGVVDELADSPEPEVVEKLTRVCRRVQRRVSL
jgi:hypothetical protein